MLYYLVTAVISTSAGVIGMGMFCARKVNEAEEDLNDAVALKDAAIDDRDNRDRLLAKCQTDYATERRKRLEAEQAHTDLADKHNATLDRIESAITLIDSIPHRKGKETLIKAKLKGEAA